MSSFFISIGPSMTDKFTILPVKGQRLRKTCWQSSLIHTIMRRCRCPNGRWWEPPSGVYLKTPAVIQLHCAILKFVGLWYFYVFLMSPIFKWYYIVPSLSCLVFMKPRYVSHLDWMHSPRRWCVLFSFWWRNGWWIELDNRMCISVKLLKIQVC